MAKHSEGMAEARENSKSRYPVTLVIIYQFPATFSNFINGGLTNFSNQVLANKLQMIAKILDAEAGEPFRCAGEISMNSAVIGILDSGPM